MRCRLARHSQPLFALNSFPTFSFDCKAANHRYVQMAFKSLALPRQESKELPSTTELLSVSKIAPCLNYRCHLPQQTSAMVGRTFYLETILQATRRDWADQSQAVMSNY